MAAAAVALGGCGLGGGGDDETPAPATASDPEAVIQEAFTSTDPGICERLFTEAALAQTQLNEGAKPPLEACREDMAEDPDAAASVEVRDLAVNGTTATATVLTSGTSLEGAALDLELVDEGGWRIAGLGDLDIVDPKTFYESFTKDLAEVEAFSPAHRRCIAAYVEDEVPLRVVEATYTSGAAGYAFDAVRECVGQGSDERAIAEVVRGELVREQGLSSSQAECVVDSVSDQFEGLKLNPELNLDTPEFEAAAQQAGAICVGPEGPAGNPSPDSPGGGSADDAYLDCVAATPVEQIKECEKEL